MPLFIFAVDETVPVEEPARAASALFAPHWMLVNVLVCKIHDPLLIREHAKVWCGGASS